MPFYYNDQGELGILLTKRSKHLKSHPGQISFPGGVREEGETLEETALREWEEEMGVSGDSIQLLDCFHSLTTITGYHITPFVGIYNGDFAFQLSDEVESAFGVPLITFLECPFYCIDFFRSGRNRVYYFDLPGQGLLWGATCEILVRFFQMTAGFNREPISTQANLSEPPFLKIPS
jgi:8-oxo-dGTP pyrophosphatase MutT (NUDIX family)